MSSIVRNTLEITGKPTQANHAVRLIDLAGLGGPSGLEVVPLAGDGATKVFTVRHARATDRPLVAGCWGDGPDAGRHVLFDWRALNLAELELTFADPLPAGRRLDVAVAGGTLSVARPVTPSFTEQPCGPLTYWDIPTKTWKQRNGYVKLVDLGALPNGTLATPVNKKVPINVSGLLSVVGLNVWGSSGIDALNACQASFAMAGNQAGTINAYTASDSGKCSIVVTVDSNRTTFNAIAAIWYVCSDRAEPLPSGPAATTEKSAHFYADDINNSLGNGYLPLFHVDDFRGMNVCFDIYAARHVSGNVADHTLLGTATLRCNYQMAVGVDSLLHVLHQSGHRHVACRIDGNRMSVYLRDENGYTDGTVRVWSAQSYGRSGNNNLGSPDRLADVVMDAPNHSIIQLDDPGMVDAFLLDEQPNGPLNYSYDEQYTGQRWVDGRRIYQKTIDFGPGPATPNLYKNVPHGISNLDGIVEATGIGQRPDGTYMSSNSADPSGTSGGFFGFIGTWFDRTYVYVRTGLDRSTTHFYITLRYTCTDR